MRYVSTGSAHSARAASFFRWRIEPLLVLGLFLALPHAGLAQEQEHYLDNYCWPLLPADTTQPPGELELLAGALPSEWPTEGICTNYDAELGDFLRYATEADPREWAPQIGNFPCMQTDDIAPDSNAIQLFVDRFERRNPHVRIRILNRLEEVDTTGNELRVQMVVNHLVEMPEGGLHDFGYSAYNLYFPPRFTVLPYPAPAPARYPVIFQANGWNASNNEIFDSLGLEDGDGGPATLDIYYPTATTLGYFIDTHGFIYVQSNGGGNGSVGFAPKYLEDVYNLLHYLETDYAANLNKMVTIGSSRSGSVALQVATNPLGFDYEVLGVFSRCPAMGAGTISQTPLASDPTLCGLYNTEFYPDQANRYSYIWPPMSDPAQVMYAPLETTDVNLCNARSPDGSHIGNFAGKYLLLCHGTQDSWMPERHWLGFETKLSRLGIRHSSVTFLNSGHNLPSSAGPWNAVYSEFVGKMLTVPNFDPANFVPPGVAYGLWEEACEYWWRGNLDNPSNFTNVERLDEQASLPFFATLPYRLGRHVLDELPNNEPFTIQLHGAQGRGYKLWAYSDQDPEHVSPLLDRAGKFPSVGYLSPFGETVEISFGFEWPAGFETSNWIDYVIHYEDAGGVWRDVSAYTNYETMPGQRIEPRTYIVDDQPIYLDYMPALWSRGGEVGAYMLGLGITWCESWPEDDIPGD
jgi:hypothetical protein